jgi:stage III sporulation protein SpoIIIAA
MHFARRRCRRASISPHTAHSRVGLAESARHYVAGDHKRNVYVIGQANIGKSTLTRALAESFFDHLFFMDRRGVGRRKAFRSLMPTVRVVPIPFQ